MSYLVIEGRLVVIASVGGANRHPQRYFNLRANPKVTVELSGVEFVPRATATQGAERARFFAAACQHSPGHAAYAAKTAREIPVIELRAEAIDLAAVPTARCPAGEAMGERWSERWDCLTAGRSGYGQHGRHRRRR
jgi:deazaflavin-dependent oxidoreductase (nitroreductase family)